MPVHQTREIAAIERRVAGEPALELEDGGAVVLFGLVPARRRRCRPPVVPGLALLKMRVPRSLRFRSRARFRTRER